MSDRRDGALALCLFALLFSLYLLTFSGTYHSSDEMSMLVVTDSLARRGAWDIELLRWMGEQQGSFGPDGHLYSRKGIGTTLVALPQYWLALQLEPLGNVQTAMLTMAVVTALTAVLVYLMLRRLGYGQGVALGVALAFGLGTMAWPYARYLFSESLAGLGLVLSAYALLRYRDRQDRSSLLWAGAGLGLALLARLNNAVVAPFLGLLLMFYLYRAHGRNWRKWIEGILLVALPVLAALAIVVWYNWLRFGDPLNTGYLAEERFATPFFVGFYGLTFSPGKGLFWYNPLLLASLVAWPAFFRRHRAEALLVATVVLSNVAFYASWYLWWAGHAWGPRFLVTILPFAILPLAVPLEAITQAPEPDRKPQRQVLAVVLGMLAIVSVAVQLLGVAVDFNLYLEEIYARLGLYHPATLFDPAYSPLLRQIGYVRLENLDLAWARGGSIDPLALMLSAIVVLASGLMLWMTWRKRRSRWLMGGLLVVLFLVTGGLLLRYTPTGDMAQATHALAAMERADEVAALSDPLSTEAFQDAYDGHLWVWGVPSKDDIEGGHEAIWVLGAGDPEPAAARFQVGAVRLDFYPSPGQAFDLTRLPVTPPEEGTYPLDALRLGDVAHPEGVVGLAGTQLGGSTVGPGETSPLALYWQALAPMGTSYTVFVQAINEAGVKAGQVDVLPCNGGCPTTTWRPGDLVGERYDLPIRADAPPGRYQLITGMYDLATGETLSWLDAQGHPLGSFLPLGTVDVQP
jgi:4-amino-4-deoxy-L-arabinose transferase-like glycosyltransferase